MTLVHMVVVASILLLAATQSCGSASSGPFVPKPAERPHPLCCFDSAGHIEGSRPFIDGGTCCCTPRPDQLELAARYKAAGIMTATDHRACNNLCEWGPHVTKGGHCMVPPTPGSLNYEEVRFGYKYVAKPKEK